MSANYQVVILEQNEASRAATLSVAPYEAPDAHSAKLWADAFNQHELSEPLGLWAVVRVAPEE
ncbi:MAG TPA: hypothetical protein VF306_00370 [Pirellulales bacterium]